MLIDKVNKLLKVRKIVSECNTLLLARTLDEDAIEEFLYELKTALEYLKIEESNAEEE